MSNSPPPTTSTNKQGQQHYQTTPGNSAGTNHQASGSTNTQNSNATGAQFFAMLGSPQGGRGFLSVVPLPSCLMPESFTGTSDFEDYLQQFKTAAFLSGWHSNTHDNRPHYFALRLKENALHFYTALSFEQQTNFDLIEAFRQNYTTNGDILKARLKAAKQLPKQDIATFLCDVRTLPRRLYGNFPEMIDPMGLTGSPNTFQSSMEQLLVGVTWKTTVPYLDDCIIFAATPEEHLERRRAVLQRFREANLKINPLKSEFFKTKVHFLGHDFSANGLQVDPEKIAAVKKFPIPTS